MVQTEAEQRIQKSDEKVAALKAAMKNEKYKMTREMQDLQDKLELCRGKAEKGNVWQEEGKKVMEDEQRGEVDDEDELSGSLETLLAHHQLPGGSHGNNVSIQIEILEAQRKAIADMKRDMQQAEDTLMNSAKVVSGIIHAEEAAENDELDVRLSRLMNKTAKCMQHTNA